MDEWRESKRRLTMKNVKETKRRKHVKFCPLVDYWLLTNGEFLMKNNLDTLCVFGDVESRRKSTNQMKDGVIKAAKIVAKL